jgi:hypothetical protein
LRAAKIVLSLALASFCLVVTFDNLTDYSTNYLFLQHVMSMDTTFPGNALMYRSITNPVLWQLGYALIIAAEGLAGLLFLAGAVRLIQVRNAPGEVFNAAKALSLPRPPSPSLSGSSVSWWWHANGSPYGSRKAGTGKRRPSASACPTATSPLGAAAATFCEGIRGIRL